MKPKKGATANPQHKHLYSRISYLYQLATRLSTTHSQHITKAEPQKNPICSPNPSTEPQPKETTSPITHPSKLSRHLLSHLRGISLKAQIRLSPSLKHAICKRCDTLLVPGSTSTSYVENKSRGGRKPWADVLVVQCGYCGSARRFPVGAKRQLGRSKRVGGCEEKVEEDEVG